MGCLLSSSVVDRPTSLTSIVGSRKAKGYNGLLEESGITPEGGTDSSKESNRPPKRTRTTAHDDRPENAVDTDKPDRPSPNEGGCMPEFKRGKTWRLHRSSPESVKAALISNAADAANPFAPMSSVYSSNAASSREDAPLSLLPQLATSSAADASPSAAMRSPRGAGYPSRRLRSSSIVSVSAAPHDMQLARQPLDPQHLKMPSTGFADMHATRESLLSDISATLSTESTPTHSLQDCHSPNCGGTMSAFLRKAEALEAKYQQVSLSIEEDLFVYDDIVISKVEARAKQWRLAGRKPQPANIEPSSDSGTSRTLKKFFSFNDFDVCVDEVDFMPLSPATVEAAATLARDTVLETPKQGLKHITVTNTTAKAPNTVAHFLAQSRSREPRVNRPLRSFQVNALLGHASRVKCIALSPAETDFASCSNEDASITLNNFGVGSEVGIFTGHHDTIISATFSPDGKYLATASKDETMILWDVTTTKILLTFAHPKVVICCCFGPDSKHLVSGCQDRVCRLWDTKRGREWMNYTEHEGIIIAIAFSPDGNYVCSASADRSLRVWSATTAKTRFHLLGHVGIILSCSYTSDGRHIISNDESLLRVWSAEDGSCKLSLSPVEVAGTLQPSHRAPKLGWTLSSAAPGSFTRFVLVACNNRFVYVIDIDTGREVASTFCKAPVYCLTAGSHEKMAFGDSFGNIYILHLM
ncbi:WD domain G-beta repeat [Leishmania donovani]|uniref:WD_domain_-_G-beta_repeat_-_putative n=3 Tax=Leishmania donovani species complex TaxID=38574 RepID=A0A6L0X109_LEIIN|nr:WD_domain_-_G-beta_repeat_-_putative [Leishmania infantum]CAJ1987808.1 WD domain G-beta repeat [Leishmania donovani]SUZ40791.1 WD_domain_-_G-beta_repeat_-_putative [Leishmania infantum]VDZ43695.1 WD_domain_G-beta_repeat_putative/Pfam:PF00400 [Leishmania donovani]